MSRTARLVAAAVLAAAVLPAVGGGTTGATAADPLYRPLSNFKPSGDKVRIAPEHYSAVRVDLGRARAELSDAPRAGARSGMVFSVPTPTGGTERFTVQRTRTMEPKLAAAHPEIATYSGRSLEQPGHHDRARHHADGLPRRGARAAGPARLVRRPGLRPARHQRAPELLRRRRAARRGGVRRARGAGDPARRCATGSSRRAPGGEVTQKVYRLALATDPTLRRVLRHRERAGREGHADQPGQPDLQRRPGDQDGAGRRDRRRSTSTPRPRPPGPTGRAARTRASTPVGDPDDPESIGQLDFCDVGTLGRNRIVLGQLVGASNYDVGHIGLGVNGGGIAYLGVVGWDYKGGGCTGLPEPQGRLLRDRLRRPRARPPVRRQPHLQRRPVRLLGGNREPDRRSSRAPARR